jgi:hypothetical protein
VSQSQLSKFLALMSLAARNPVELYDRVITKLETRSDKIEQSHFKPKCYRPAEWNDVITRLGEHLGSDIGMILREPELSSIEAEVRSSMAERLARTPFKLAHCSDFMLARLCYALVRAARPRVVVETGVAYGVSSAFILKALAGNGQGALHSVDLPPLGLDSDDFVGILIPQLLRDRWQLHRGPARRVLPKLLPRLGSVDIFIHDSLHTYSTMTFEFQTVEPYLAPSAVLLADDIDQNPAFSDWVAIAKPAYSGALREPEKGTLCGVGVREARPNPVHGTGAYD